MFISVNKGAYDNIITAASINDIKPVENQKIIRLYDTEMFFFIIDCLSENKIVKYSIDIENPTIKDLVIQTNQENNVNFFISELTKYFKNKLNKIDDFTYFQYQNLNNFFSSKGYNICSENKELVYIEILQSGDKKLIKKLEQYLSVLNQLESFSECYEMYLETYDKIKSADSDKEKFEILEDFKNSFKF